MSTDSGGARLGVDLGTTWTAAAVTDRAGPTLTMFACHPKGSAEQRIVVVAELVSNQRML
jgi:sortase (surface protein transpeptidase)